MTKYEMTQVDAVTNDPQAKSMRVMWIGQSYIVAKLVKSYVAYVTNPQNIPANRACCQSSFSIAGSITK